MIHLLSGLVIVFKLWLVTDALRRREACYWPWIIFLVPLGGVVYFFLIKIDDYSLAWTTHWLRTHWFRKSPSLDDLRFQYEETPSFANRVALAGAFYREGRYAEAADHYTGALEQEPRDPDALYGMGLTLIAEHDCAKAAEHLTTLVDQDRSYRQYAAWPPLAHALFACGRSEECLAALRKLVDDNPRMAHKMLLARYLSQAGQVGEARELLRETLLEHDRSPRFLKRLNFWNARQAKGMLQSFDERASCGSNLLGQDS